MKILFWNIKNKPETKTDVLSELIKDKDPDLFFIAESNKDFDLGNVDSNYIKVDFKGNKSRKIVTGFAKSQVKLTSREYYFDGRIALCVFEKSSEKVAVCGVHLWSKVDEEFEQRYHSGPMRTEIFKICDLYNKVIFIGDFNLAPWDVDMYSILGVNAIPWSSEISSNNFIIKNNTKHYLLYNPMWNYLGDETLGTTCGAKGSYNLEKKGKLKWQFIDQVVCSRDLINKVFPNKIQIIEKVKLNNNPVDILVKDSNGKHKYSDHYPIFCDIN